ncbi:Xaa-Pro peptidase family protein [Pseudonocardia sp. MH-G8]|uniref:M24 family metallopeptidase n=1 Tax=Pseudonocardia sp. MH-G8 TaxID=1854588 RepID=UPI000BA017B9|nr:Xaa-Pro peptidase family protein [Pseudonocardia sp. MH-G8]OZM75759.1 peptidase M24 [Pseudonocardia sp. MH-G8]
MSAMPLQEFDDRMRRIRSALEITDLGGLLAYGDCWRASNVSYFTSFRPLDGVGDYPTAAVLLPRHGDPELFVAEGAMGWAADVTNFAVRNIADIAGAVTAWSAQHHGAALGLAGSGFIPAVLLDRVTDALGGVRPTPTDVLAEVKAVKSEWEIDILREAARFNDIAMEVIRVALATGKTYTERELARMADAAMIDAGADGVAFLSMVQSGPRASWNLALPSDRPIQRGDLVLTDIGARYKGYSADGGRGFSYGDITDEQRSLMEASVAAVEAGMAAVRPGLSARELNRVIQEELVTRGYAEYSGEARGHGTGHGTGMDPEEEQPWISPHNPIVLTPDMVFTLKATITVPVVGGLRTERIVRVTESGSEALDQFPMLNTW